MASRTYRAAPSWDATSARRRGSGLGLAIAVTGLIVLVLLGVGVAQQRPKASGESLVVDLVTAPQEKVARESKAAAKREVTKPKPPRIIPPPPPPVAKPLDMLVLTKEEFAAADIRKLARATEPKEGRADDSAEVGRAPNGEVLYGAEWYRRPTDAELSGYLPRNAPDGWGLIACRTIPGYRVEDCVELANYPAGSRLSGAVRQAAWQFRVRPPRKNGRELVGAWVQIRIEYVRTAAK